MDAFTRRSPVKVLVVEDEQTLAENIGVYLAALGGEVRLAGDGAVAIAIVSARCNDFVPDVLVLDYNLPDMDGFELLDAIHRCGCPCSCVLITAHPGQRITAEAQRRGIAHVLFKPFALAELARSVFGATAGRR